MKARKSKKRRGANFHFKQQVAGGGKESVDKTTRTHDGTINLEHKREEGGGILP